MEKKRSVDVLGFCAFVYDLVNGRVRLGLVVELVYWNFMGKL